MTPYQTERMTHDLQDALAFAHDFAETHSLHFITPEILLLGILQQENTPATQALETLDISLDKLQAKILDSLPPVAAVRTENIAMTPRTQKVMDFAFQHARRQQQQFIGVEHLLWALMQEISGFPARLLTEGSSTLENMQPTLGETSLSAEVQREEFHRRRTNAEMTKIWEKMRATEETGTPHLPKWVNYSLRAIMTLIFFMFVLLVGSNSSHWTETLVPCLIVGAITFGVWHIGVPRKTRQLAQKFQQWDNPAIVGTLCDMLTWSDNLVRKEAMAGLTRLLPHVHTAELNRLYSSHGSLLSPMLTSAMAQRETDFVLAIIAAYERIGAVREKFRMRELAQAWGETPEMHRVQAAAKNCLATLELIEQQTNQQQTLLRAAASASDDTLLRASLAPSETKPDELLRPAEE